MVRSQVKVDRDEVRYQSLRTDFARERFWKLRNHFGIKYWRVLQYAVRVNSDPNHMKDGWECRGAFDIVCRSKRRLDNAWKSCRDDMVLGSMDYTQSLIVCERVAMPLVEGDDGVVQLTQIRQLDTFTPPPASQAYWRDRKARL